MLLTLGRVFIHADEGLHTALVHLPGGEGVQLVLVEVDLVRGGEGEGGQQLRPVTRQHHCAQVGVREEDVAAPVHCHVLVFLIYIQSL